MKQIEVYHKLVRDKIPEIIAASGGEPTTRTLTDDAEFLAALDAKLLEEVQEYLATPSAEELADILEVLEAIVAMRRIPQPELRRAKNAKTLKNGTFHARVFLESVTRP